MTDEERFKVGITVNTDSKVVTASVSITQSRN